MNILYFIYYLLIIQLLELSSSSSTGYLLALSNTSFIYSRFSSTSHHEYETSYEVILINRYMSMEVIDKVLNHINDCYQYSVDTESEMSNNELSIIQFHTIPRTLPSQVLIIELSQLPNRESHLSRNEIYSWGNMNLELESANYLFAWPITSELINLQPHFADKTNTLSHWSYGLTSIGSSLTQAQRTRMINYAKYDVMAVTYLIRPITEQWSFTRTKESSIEEMFITFQSIRPPPLRQQKSKKKKKNINIQKLSKIFTSIQDP
ncbi:unnamed protein product, partial [Rotaria sordida]